MNLDPNIISYAIYLPLLTVLIIWVGKLCHDNGEVWMLSLFEDKEFIKAVNRILLIAYYLLNIGYTAYTLGSWPEVQNEIQLIEELAQRTSHIVLILATLHYINILAFSLWSKFAKQGSMIEVQNIKPE